MENKILLYTTPDGQHKIEVNLNNDTLWLSLEQIAELFDRNKSTISRHIRNIFNDRELQQDSVVAKFATTASDGKTYNVDYYNLDMIISVGYRGNSLRGTHFRIWATQVLREFLVKGKELLSYLGTISAEIAKLKAHTEHDRFRDRVKNDLSPVEIHFIDSFEQAHKKLKK